MQACMSIILGPIFEEYHPERDKSMAEHGKHDPYIFWERCVSIMQRFIEIMNNQAEI
jgi:hypothetical protein